MMVAASNGTSQPAVYELMQPNANQSAVWLFTVTPARPPQPAHWQWERLTKDAMQSEMFATFDACVRDARQHGFDFSHEYHVTVARSQQDFEA
jgi:hypothetical protein